MRNRKKISYIPSALFAIFYLFGVFKIYQSRFMLCVMYKHFIDLSPCFAGYDVSAVS
jgi:hypothetical protein